MSRSATVPSSIQQIARQALRPAGAQKFVDCVGEGEEQTASKLEQFQLSVPLESLIPTMWAILKQQQARPIPPSPKPNQTPFRAMWYSWYENAHVCGIDVAGTNMW